ncbi:hypothetical protein Nepgr_003564 [Nepenthes gracilis]|uniref:Uncharacterized protein n=1 Tax=Nepenthes gracilis TaxID=150966 RepID=A0AAD3XE02_NEPGR|nr:hypothetical protein Nepgr_003564 [Nepenthes gracilis]
MIVEDSTFGITLSEATRRRHLKFKVRTKAIRSQKPFFYSSHSVSKMIQSDRSHQII